MAADRVGDMTLEELNALIERVVDRRLRQIPRRRGKRTMAELNASIRRNRIIPPPGAKSALEMLREDRDRFYRTLSNQGEHRIPAVPSIPGGCRG
jgi:hypothetical protein